MLIAVETRANGLLEFNDRGSWAKVVVQDGRVLCQLRLISDCRHESVTR